MGGLDFFIGRLGVGIFEDTEGPRTPGRYSYMPYRSVGHYQMITVLREGGHPRCFCDTEEEHVEFTVRAHRGYGLLEIGDIERTPRER